MNELETFKQISIGGMTKKSLIQRMADADIHFNKYANVLFEHHAFLLPSPF